MKQATARLKLRSYRLDCGLARSWPDLGAGLIGVCLGSGRGRRLATRAQAAELGVA